MSSSVGCMRAMLIDYGYLSPILKPRTSSALLQDSKNVQDCKTLYWAPLREAASLPSQFFNDPSGRVSKPALQAATVTALPMEAIHTPAAQLAQYTSEKRDFTLCLRDE